MSTGKTPSSFSACYQPVAVTEWNRSGFCILIVILCCIDLDTSKEGHLLETSFFICCSLFMNLHQLAPYVALFGTSPEEEEQSPSSPLPGGDLHSWERQGLTEPAGHVVNAAGEHRQCCMASSESCDTVLTTAGKKGKGLESTGRPGAHEAVPCLVSSTLPVKWVVWIKRRQLSLILDWLVYRIGILGLWRVS